MRTPSKESGFTLVEMLIALFIFALISVGTMTALTNSIRGKTQMNERLADIQNIETARALLKADMTNLTLRTMRDAYGGTEPNMLEGGVDTLLTFSRYGRTNPGGLEKRGDIQRVSYVFENGQLIRRSLMQDNPAPQTKMIDRVLLSDLNFAVMEFVSGEGTRTLKDGQIFIPVTQLSHDVNGIELTLQFDTGQELTQYFEVDL